MQESWDEPPPFILTSSTKGVGREEMLRYISKLISDDIAFKLEERSNAQQEISDKDVAQSSIGHLDNDTVSDAKAPVDARSALPWIQRTLQESHRRTASDKGQTHVARRNQKQSKSQKQAKSMDRGQGKKKRKR